MGQEHYLLIFQSFPKYQTSLESKGLIGLSFRMRWICVFFLSSQLRSSSGLKTIDNGVGPIIWGAEEKVVDYAVLADDETAALPSQVTSFSVFNFCFFLIQFTICSSTTWEALTTNLCFFQLQRESGKPWMTLVLALAGSRDPPSYRITVKSSSDFRFQNPIYK